MKLRTLALVFVLPCLGLACQEQAAAPEDQPAPAAQPAAAGTPEGQPAAQPAAQPVLTGVDICKGIVEAAKAKDDAKVTAMATDGAADVLAGEGVKDHVYALLGEAACGEETKSEDGTKVAVALTKGEEKLELPLVKAGEALKVDVAAFVEKNPIKKDGKGKKEKGKKDKAKKGKKAKK